MKTQFVIAVAVVVLLPVLAQAQPPAGSACTGPNGSRFNLEPRANAVVQAALSVAVLPGRAQNSADLVATTATDMRSISAGSNDVFYVQRSNSNCRPDLEGELPEISNASDLFSAAGTPIVVADPVRDAFFFVDERFGVTTDENGVGILRATSASLQNSQTCLSGTQHQGSAGCFVAASVFNITSLNTFLSSPQIAVDQRTTGTGAGDVYTAVTENDSVAGKVDISLMACVNATLNCSNTVKINGTDSQPDFASVQVRPDGQITITYRNTKFPGVNPEDIKFVVCKPNGAPAAPTCQAPVLIAHANTPDFDSSIGVTSMIDAPYPIHVNRLERDGKTVTTFVVWDRCAVPVFNFNVAIDFCPKTDVVITSSSDGGATWSTPAKVTTSNGEQFFGTVALDASTGTVNVAYYSTENDPALQDHAQVFLSQVAPGATSVGKPQLLTSAFADPEAISPLFVLLEPTGLGNRLGLAAAGSGQIGQSRAYVTFTWNTVPGIYAGVSSPDTNNHLALFQY